MTVIDDITALLTPVLHTNTTKDITAAAVRAALIEAFTDIVNDVDAKEAATLAAQIQPSRIAQAAGTAKSNGISLIDARVGQLKPGLPTLTGSDLPYVFSAGALAGGDIDKKLAFGGGLESGASVGWLTSDYFPVPSGGTVTAAKLDTGPGLCFYDINRTFISNVSGDGLTTPQVITVPSNAVYGRASVEYFGDTNSSINACQVLVGTWTTMPHGWQTTIGRASMGRPWIGRTWSMHGDGWWSSDVGQDWFVRAAQYHGVKKAKQEAHGGGRAATLLNGADGSTPLALSFWDDVDACFVFTGLKDATDPGGLPSGIGAITDATTATTFFGYYRKFIETVLTRNPFMRMILGVPHHVDGFATSATNPYIAAVRSLGDFYSLKLLDFKAESQWSPFSFPFYAKGAGGGGTVDTAHPGWHQGSINSLNPPLKSDWGEYLVYGGPLKGLMHTVFPVDHFGDPVLVAGDTATFV
jgi:hypothetical protein